MKNSLSITIGKIEGIEIKLNYSLLLAFALITWSLASGFLPIEYPGHGPIFNWGIGAISAIALFLSILAHELSHSTVALRQGIGIRSITLFFFGGVSQIEESTKSPSNELRMAIAGPLMSLLIGAVLYVLYYLLGGLIPAAIAALLQYVGLVNLLLGFFNLVPAFPMDGGRVLRSIFWNSRNDMISATRTATKVSHLISYIFIGLGFISSFVNLISGIWLIFLGIFINRGAEAELEQSIAEKKLEGTKLRELMNTNFKIIPSGTTIKTIRKDYLTNSSQNIYPVSKDNKIVGIITASEIENAVNENLAVDNFMKELEDSQIANPNEDASNTLMRMARNGLSSLIVFEDGKVVGLITSSDLNKIVDAGP